MLLVNRAFAMTFSCEQTSLTSRWLPAENLPEQMRPVPHRTGLANSDIASLAGGTLSCAQVQLVTYPGRKTGLIQQEQNTRRLQCDRSLQKNKCHGRFPTFMKLRSHGQIAPCKKKGLNAA